MDIFTYGTLMFKSIWQTIVNGDYGQSAAMLSGYQRVYIRDDCYPVLRPAAINQKLEGLVYFGVSATDLKRLDVFEGDYYERKTLPVTLISNKGSHDKRLVQVYVLTAGHRHLASKRLWHPDRFAAQHLDRYERALLNSPRRYCP